jgi:hypothetical protein
LRRMSDTTTNLPALPPSAASDDIRRALADVDARLSAWAAAVAKSGPVAPDPAPAKPAPASADQPTEPVVAPAKPKVVEAAAPPAAPTKPQSRVKSETPPKPESASKPVPAPKVEATKKPAPEPAPAAAPPAARPQTEQEEDEALLASLDAETVQAIKVMRRLSFEKKSIRQLLEEYEQTRQPQGSSESRKKSWWSRG